MKETSVGIRRQAKCRNQETAGLPNQEVNGIFLHLFCFPVYAIIPSTCLLGQESSITTLGLMLVLCNSYFFLLQPVINWFSVISIYRSNVPLYKQRKKNDISDSSIR